MGLVDSKIYALWIAKQVDRATPAVAAIKRMRQVAGNVRVDRSDGSERYGTLGRFGGAQDFVDVLAGGGEPGVQGSPGVLAYLLYLFAGQESVGPIAGDVYPHTITPSANGGFWVTVWKRVGNPTDYVREKFNEAKISQLSIEASTGQKVLRVTPTIMALDPGEKYAADPVKDFDTAPDDEGFLYTEGEGAFEVNGTVIRAQSQFNVTLGDALDYVNTDSVKPLDLAAGTPTATVAATFALNDEALARYNFEVYGDVAPAAGTKPLKSLPALGSYGFTLTKGSRSFAFSMPGVKWTPDVAVEPNPAGGLTEISLAGEMRPLAGEPEWEAIVNTVDAAYA